MNWPVDIDLAEFVDTGKATPRKARAWSSESYETRHWADPEWSISRGPSGKRTELLPPLAPDNPLECSCDACIGISRAQQARRKRR